jgi:hypothetical protein
MKKFVKWLISGSVILVLTGLAVLQLLALFSGVTECQPGKDSVFQSLVVNFKTLPETFRETVQSPESAHSVRISVTPAFPQTVAAVSEMSAEEMAVKQQLEKMLTSGESTHRLVYDGVKTMTGRLVEEHPDHIVFAQKYGDSGEMSVQLPLNRIVRIESFAAEHPAISRRDIRFYMEFPDKQFYKSPPYTIITEESFFAVEHIVQQLQDLYTQITEEFGSLIAASCRRDDVQLLIFSDVDAYPAYRDRYAPELKSSSGFYSHGMDRMVVYHQRDADWVKDGKKQIAAVEKKYEGKLRTEQARQSFSQWKNSARSQLLAQADRATQSVIRHEGAHQLLFTLGVQNPAQNGRGWVAEGLATFCETEKPGRINAERVDQLKSTLADGKLIPLRALMAAPRCESLPAYAEAWSLTHMLMQPEYRSGFMAYLNWLRNHPFTFGSDPVQELCQFISLQPDELESRWGTYLTKLVSQ